ncbi:uncharacterized protein [Macrobrachium rosenbergii]|uniref:uncharacterized protein n=1 Tax=Macrobrachium rosenbergii TaxID=79674 RepID=UPI0034D4AE63
MLQGRPVNIKRFEVVLCACVALYVIYTLTGTLSLPLSQSQRNAGNSAELGYSKSESRNDVIKPLPRETMGKGNVIQREMDIGTSQGERFVSIVKFFEKTPVLLSEQNNLPNHVKKAERFHFQDDSSHDYRRPSEVTHNSPLTQKAGVSPVNLCSVTFDLDLCSCSRTLTLPFPTACPTTVPSPGNILETMKESFGNSICGDWATIRGPKQKIVSYSVHGSFPNDYYRGLESLVPAIADAYPGWTMRVYHRLDESNATIRNWLCSLACKYPHLDYCNVDKISVLSNVRGKTSGQAWRFSVMGDRLVDGYMVRDADSPILQREVDAVHDWLNSTRCFHIMRDNIFHRAPIMAGMWGGCNTWREQQFRIVRDQMFQDVSNGMGDQSTLKSRLWPLAQENATIHDSYNCGRFPGSQPFPSQRANFTFVGQRTYRKWYRKERTFLQCPWRCRPRQHPDWVYC